MPALNPMAERPEIARREIVFNVAYGSNLSKKKLISRTPEGRAEIAPLSVTRVTVAGYRLDFGLACIPPLEPVMADVVRDDQAVLHGVMYELTAYDYESLCRSEHCAIHFPSYLEEVVIAQPYDKDTPGSRGSVTATLFVHHWPARRVCRSLYVFPSRRYMSLIIDGASESQLDRSYIARLEALPTARPVPDGPLLAALQLSMHATFSIFALDRWMFAGKLLKLLKDVVFPCMVKVYGRRERAAAKNRQQEEMVWTLILILFHLPFAMLGAGLKLAGRGRVRILFRE